MPPEILVDPIVWTTVSVLFWEYTGKQEEWNVLSLLNMNTDLKKNPGVFVEKYIELQHIREDPNMQKP